MSCEIPAPSCFAIYCSRLQFADLAIVMSSPLSVSLQHIAFPVALCVTGDLLGMQLPVAHGLRCLAVFLVTEEIAKANWGFWAGWTLQVL